MTRYGKPATVLINYLEYERVRKSIDILIDADLMAQL